MKQRDIATIIKNRGLEKGVVYVLEAMYEDVTVTKKNLVALAGMVDTIIDSLNNVVNGAEGMKRQMQSTLQKAGIMVEADDLGPNTSDPDGDKTEH